MFDRVPNTPLLFILLPTQLIFICSKSTIETVEKGVKYVKLTITTGVSIFDFQQVNVIWVV